MTRVQSSDRIGGQRAAKLTHRLFGLDSSTADRIVLPDALAEVADRAGVPGGGMSADTLAHAFDHHFTTKANRVGAGLGLSQVQAFVQRSRGALQVNSSLGVGTTISIYLPSASSPTSP